MAQRQISRDDSEAAQGRLAAIVEQTDRLSDMLETFLDAARIGSGRLPLRPDRVDLGEVIEDAAVRARSLRLGGEQSDREFECVVPAGCVGNWDRARITRAIRALLANALLYGDPDTAVRIEARRMDDRVLVTISGGGPGPGPDEVPHLFERFYRGRSAAEAGQAGSGLGLFTARGIARVHGGDVRRLEGDRFEIELPLTN
jgi:signal transduction histidine kinase